MVMKPMPRSAVILSIVVVLCATLSSMATLLWQGSFPDLTPETLENSMLAEARGWSAATLLVAIPLSVLALWRAARGSVRARLFWLGTVAYFVYMDLELAVSPPFTALYLVYILGFACAVATLVLGTSSIVIDELPKMFGDRAPPRTVAIFSTLVALFLAAAWLKSIAARTFAGNFGWPTGAAGITHVVQALDLGMQVPLGISTTIMLLRRQPSGWLLASIMLVNGVCMGAALTGMVLFSTADAHSTSWVAAPFAVVTLVGVLVTVLFFRSMVGYPQQNAAQR